MFRKLCLSLLSLILTFGLVAQKPIDLNNIEIVRDEYGVPHIFTETDVETVYGLAWAQCEDNFNMIQDNLSLIKGLGGRVLGKKAAAVDFICEIFQFQEFVEKKYERDINDEMESFLYAYVSGVNRYAELNPKEVKDKKIFPVHEKEILALYLLNFQLTNSTAAELGKFLVDEFDYQSMSGITSGSNAMAYSPNITADGKAYLVGNPHQPVNTIGNFWEVSVHSKEGYEMYGVTFAAGGLFPVIGTNRNLGWTHTMNYQNSADIYQLEMHPTKKHFYKYDGEWIPLEKKKAKLKVKIGPIVIPVKKKYFISKYGPTLKKASGYYAYKSFVFYNLKAPEQWYKMGLAKNKAEFMEALAIQGLANQTITYADKDMNIFHLSNFAHPYRDDQYDWTAVTKGNTTILPGNTSANNWPLDKKYPIAALPQVVNPKCGYVFNTNNTPYNMTGLGENPQPADFPMHFGILHSNNVRSKTFENLISKKEKVTFEDVRKIRESITVNKNDMSLRNCMNCGDMPKIIAAHPALQEERKVLDKWNGSFDIKNKQATLFQLTSLYIIEYIIANFGNEDKDVPESVMIDALQKASKFLMKHYGSLEVELGKVQKAKRFDVSLPMYGGGNTLAASSFEFGKNGQLELIGGDTYIIYAKYGKEGLEELNTINAFGNSMKKDNPHSVSQAEMYVNMQTKAVELDLAKLKKVGKIYHPK